MNIFGIVAEYNPFHNGHKFQVDTAFKLGATHVIVIMSPNFTQRGEPSITDKWYRAKAAIKSGVDLVLELPTTFALSSAERFAFGAVYLLNKLNIVDRLVFGAETDNLDALNNIIDKLETDVFNERLRSILKNGFSFPKARQIALESFFKKDLCNQNIVNIISKPNNILAIEYLKWLKRLNSKIKPLIIKRKGPDHDGKHILNDITSALNLRELLKQQQDIKVWQNFVPCEAYEVYKEAFERDMMPAMEINGERAVIAKLRSATVDSIKLIADVSEGLENRILNSIKFSSSLNEIYQNIKTKRYTMSRIKRIIYNLFLEIDVDKLQALPQYIRVLACNRKGLNLIERIKKQSDINIGYGLNKLSKINDIAKINAEIEIKASNLYGLFYNTISECDIDLKRKFEIY